MNISIVCASLERFNDFLRLYYDFYRELRNRQGLEPHSIEEYIDEAKRHIQNNKIFIAYYDEEAVGFIRISEREGCHWIEEVIRPTSLD